MRLDVTIHQFHLYSFGCIPMQCESMNHKLIAKTRGCFCKKEGFWKCCSNVTRSIKGVYQEDYIRIISKRPASVLGAHILWKRKFAFFFSVDRVHHLLPFAVCSQCELADGFRLLFHRPRHSCGQSKKARNQQRLKSILEAKFLLRVFFTSSANLVFAAAGCRVLRSFGDRAASTACRKPRRQNFFHLVRFVFYIFFRSIYYFPKKPHTIRNLRCCSMRNVSLYVLRKAGKKRQSLRRHAWHV